KMLFLIVTPDSSSVTEPFVPVTCIAQSVSFGPGVGQGCGKRKCQRDADLRPRWNHLPVEPEQKRKPSSPLGPTDATPVHLAFAVALHWSSLVQRWGLPSGGYGSVPGSKTFLFTQPPHRFDGSSGFGKVTR